MLWFGYEDICWNPTKEWLASLTNCSAENKLTMKAASTFEERRAEFKPYDVCLFNYFHFVSSFDCIISLRFDLLSVWLAVKYLEYNREGIAICGMIVDGAFIKTPVFNELFLLLILLGKLFLVLWMHSSLFPLKKNKNKKILWMHSWQKQRITIIFGWWRMTQDTSCR